VTPTPRSPDASCSATTIRDRRDEWIAAGVFAALEQLCLEAYDRIVGLDLENLAVDGCIVKAPCGGEAAGKSPVDRGKQGTKRSVLTEGTGVPLSCVVAPANRNDSPLLRPSLEKLARFGLDLPTEITVHLDAGYHSAVTRDLLDELGCHGVISQKGFPLQAGARWVIERTNSAQPRLQQARHLHRTTHTRPRSLHRSRERRHRRPPTTRRSLDHPPLGCPTDPAPVTYPHDL